MDTPNIFFRSMAIAALLLAGAFTASADEIYTYTGPAPADLSGSFTTSAILAPNSNLSGLSNAFFIGVTSFSFTDGVDTWTPANSSFGGTAFINTDGSFLVWAFGVRDLSGQPIAQSLALYGAFYYEDITPVGNSWVANENLWAKPKGSWTMTDPVATPEPETCILLAIGLLITYVALQIYLAAEMWSRRKPKAKVWEPLA